jgi:hypothetical protein
MAAKVIATADKVGYELAGGVARSVASKLGEVVSIRDYGADGTGVVDCSAILTGMLAAGHRIIFFPAGIYRFPTKVNVPAGTALLGAGWQDCEILAEGDWWIECFRNHAPGVTTDWCRCTVTGFLITMARGGVRFWGHEFRASELRFAGGGAHMDMADATSWIADPDAWCLEGIGANELYLGRISGGYGGNNAVNTLFANGIRLTALDVDATDDLANYLETPAAGQNQRGVNYGDGLLEEISLKGRCREWVGLEISHQSTSTGVQNMLQVQRVQVQASDVPASLHGDASMAVEVSAGLYTWKGSVGVRLERVRRCLFEAVNTETSEVAWDLIGSYRLDAEGNPIQTIATERNSFIACPAMNSVTNYRDNNDAIAGAVKDNHFQGGQSFGPLQPTGVSTNPAEGGNAIMAGLLDTYLPGQLWFSQTQTGLPQAWLRFSPSQDFLLGVAGSPDPGNTLEDSHPRNDHPRRAIGIRTAFDNEAQIFLPRAAAQGRTARLKLGNGEDDTSAGPLEAILLADPVRLPRRTTQPTLTGALSQGTLQYAESNAALGGGTVSRWVGPGPYLYLDRATHPTNFNGYWLPAAPPPGSYQASIGRTGTAYTVDEEWFGRLSEHGHGSNASAITVPAGLILDKYVEPTVVPRPGRWFAVARTGNAEVKLVAGSNVAIHHPAQAGGELIIPQWATAICFYSRIDGTSARLSVSGF